MKSNDFKDRFKAGTLEFSPKCSIDMLTVQHEFMRAYLQALKERAVIEGIEL